jgi:hypothetical protein
MKTAKIKFILMVFVLTLGLASTSFAQFTDFGPPRADGFPMWIGDSSGLKMQLCLDFDPPLAAELGPCAPEMRGQNIVEAIYWEAFSQVRDADKRARLIMWIEAANDPEMPEPIILNGMRIRLENGGEPLTEYRVDTPFGWVNLTSDESGRINAVFEGIGLASNPIASSDQGPPDHPIFGINGNPATTPEPGQIDQEAPVKFFLRGVLEGPPGGPPGFIGGAVLAPDAGEGEAAEGIHLETELANAPSIFKITKVSDQTVFSDTNLFELAGRIFSEPGPFAVDATFEPTGRRTGAINVVAPAAPAGTTVLGVRAEPAIPTSIGAPIAIATNRRAQAPTNLVVSDGTSSFVTNVKDTVTVDRVRVARNGGVNIRANSSFNTLARMSRPTLSAFDQNDNLLGTLRKGRNLRLREAAGVTQITIKSTHGGEVTVDLTAPQ